LNWQSEGWSIINEQLLDFGLYILWFELKLNLDWNGWLKISKWLSLNIHRRIKDGEETLMGKFISPKFQQPHISIINHNIHLMCHRHLMCLSTSKVTTHPIPHSSNPHYHYHPYHHIHYHYLKMLIHLHSRSNNHLTWTLHDQQNCLHNLYLILLINLLSLWKT